MKMIAAVIKHTKLDDVQRALSELGVEGMTVIEVKGFGKQKGHSEIYRGMEYEVRFLPKLKVEVAVRDEQYEPVLAAIAGAARTGEDGAIGDGKIFSYDLVEVVRIRTGEKGKEVI